MTTAESTGDGVPVSELSYTEASGELDAIVSFFEQREVDVDQLVVRLERATAIVDELDRRVRRTRAQVEELVPAWRRSIATSKTGQRQENQARPDQTATRSVAPRRPPAGRKTTSRPSSDPAARVKR